MRDYMARVHIKCSANTLQLFSQKDIKQDLSNSQSMREFTEVLPVVSHRTEIQEDSDQFSCTSSPQQTLPHPSPLFLILFHALIWSYAFLSPCSNVQTACMFSFLTSTWFPPPPPSPAFHSDILYSPISRGGLF